MRVGAEKTGVCWMGHICHACTVNLRESGITRILSHTIPGEIAMRVGALGRYWTDHASDVWGSCGVLRL